MDGCGLKVNSSWRHKSVCHDVLVKKSNGILILEIMTMLFNDRRKPPPQKRERKIKRKNTKKKKNGKRKRRKKMVK